METHLFGHVNLSRRRIHFLNGVAPDPVAECARYEAAIRRAGGIDLQILGIGANGHIGFNEPAAGLIGDSTWRGCAGHARSNADLFDGRVQAVPPNALSMGVGTILRSRATSWWPPAPERPGRSRRRWKGWSPRACPRRCCSSTASRGLCGPRRRRRSWRDAESARAGRATRAGAPRCPRRGFAHCPWALRTRVTAFSNDSPSSASRRRPLRSTSPS